MFGYIETGSARNAASPAITMNAETTVANSGRSMKKFEITASLARPSEHRRRARPARSPGRFHSPVDARSPSRRAFAGAPSTLSIVACTAAPGCTLRMPSTTTRSPAVSPSRRRRRCPSSGRAARASRRPCSPCADDPDERALRAVHQRALRNHERCRHADAGDPGAHDSARQQPAAAAVVEHGADRDRAGGIVDARRDVLDRRLRADGPSARVDDAHLHEARGSRRAPQRTSSASASGNANFDVEPVRLHDVGEQARVVAGGHEAALGADLAAREPRDRRAHVRVGKIELRAFERRLGRRHGGLRRSRTPRSRCPGRAGSRASGRTAARCGRARDAPAADSPAARRAPPSRARASARNGAGSMRKSRSPAFTA